MSLNNTNSGATISTGEQYTTGLGIFNANFTHAYSAPQLTSGTGANKAQKSVTLQLTIGTSGSTLDLTAVGPGVNGVSNVNFTKIKEILVENTDGTAANYIIVGAAGSNAWEGFTTVTGSTVVAWPLGCVYLTAPGAAGLAGISGSAVVDGTHKNLKLAAAAGSGSVVNVTIVGEGS